MKPVGGWCCGSARSSALHSPERCATRGLTWILELQQGRSRWRAPMSDPTCNARLVYRPEYEAYDFGAEHPLRPARIRASLDLIACLGLGPTADEQLQPAIATRDELKLVHSSAYIDAVLRLDAFADDPLIAAEASRWGLGSGDSPAFVGMDNAAAFFAGGSLRALRGVLDGTFQHA